MRAREVIGLILALGIIGCTAEPASTTTVSIPSVTPTPTPSLTPTPTPTPEGPQIVCVDEGCEADALEAWEKVKEAEELISLLWEKPDGYTENAAWAACAKVFYVDEETDTDTLSMCYHLWLDKAMESDYHLEGRITYGWTRVQQKKRGELSRRYFVVACYDQSAVRRIDNTTGEDVTDPERKDVAPEEYTVEFNEERGGWKVTRRQESENISYIERCQK
jgi:hypothetical protein